jgi:hypothetical protein
MSAESNPDPVDKTRKRRGDRASSRGHAGVALHTPVTRRRATITLSAEAYARLDIHAHETSQHMGEILSTLILEQIPRYSARRVLGRSDAAVDTGEDRQSETAA